MCIGQLAFNLFDYDNDMMKTLLKEQLAML